MDLYKYFQKFIFNYIIVRLMERKDIIERSRKVVVKIGTNALSNPDGTLSKRAVSDFAGQISTLHKAGKKIILVVLAKGDKVKEALDAGADLAGSDELVEKIKGGWTDFSAIVATPDMMREVGKLGKILGPRGLMPSPKAGTVTKDVAKAVSELKAGKVEYKIDKNACINNSVGKVSFPEKDLKENINTILSAIHRAKPASAKGVYMKALTLASTMGPGVKIDLSTLTFS